MAQHRARTADRDQAVDTINNAYAEGQLTDAERSVRVTKALKARTLLQLERVTLDLQLPPPPPAPSTPPAKPISLREQFRRNAAHERNQWRHVPRWQKILIGAMAAACIGGLGAISVFSDGSDDRDSSLTDASREIPLTADGFTSFIQSYESEFDTTQVVLATFASDGVTLKVPTDDGKARHEDWIYRDGEFEKVDDARRNADEQGPINLATVDLEQLVVNISDAKKTLNVEDPDSTLVWVERSYRDGQPTVRIQIGNEFGEIGMLVTDLSGTTEIDRSPFKAPTTS